MAIEFDFTNIKERSEAAHKAKAEEIITDIKGGLPQVAKEYGYSRVIVGRFPFFRQYGRMTFDGNIDHLRGWPKVVWDYLGKEGLNPKYFTLQEPADFGGYTVQEAEWLYIVADWSEPSLANRHLRLLTDQAHDRIMRKCLLELPGKIDQAVAANREYASIFAFDGLTKPNAIFPFDGSIKGLTGPAAMLWQYIESSPGVFPRLYPVRRPLLDLPGMCGEFNFADDGRRFHIAACWYDRDDSGEHRS